MRGRTFELDVSLERVLGWWMGALLLALSVLGCAGAHPAAPPEHAPPPVEASVPVAKAEADPDPPTAEPGATASALRKRTDRIGPTLVARQIGKTPAWVITHEQPIPANALLFIAEDGTPILADTPWTPAATSELLAWVRKRFGRLPGLATVSHYHLDAIGGIGALQAAGVPVVASTHTAQLSSERGPAMQATLAQEHGAMFEGFEVPAPGETFAPEQGVSRTVGGTEVQVIFPGGAHAHDNVVTWFPAARVLFGGCLVKGGDTLGYLGDANMETYADAVQRLVALDPLVVVPGHGDRIDPQQLARTLELVHAARAAP